MICFSLSKRIATVWALFMGLSLLFTAANSTVVSKTGSHCLSPSLSADNIFVGRQGRFVDDSHPEISYAQDAYRHETGSYEMNTKYRSKYLHLFLNEAGLKHTDYFPLVMPSIPMRFSGAGKRSLIKQIPFPELDSSANFHKLVERMKNSKAAQNGKIVMMHPNKLHFVLVSNLNHAISLNPQSLPPFKIKLQGLWWSKNENSQLFLKVYPQTNALGFDVIGDVLRGGRPLYTPIFKPTVYPVRLFCLRENLSQEEALELQQIVDEFNDADFGTMDVPQLEVAYRVDRVLAKSAIVPLPLGQNPFDTHKYSIPTVSWQLTKFQTVSFASQTLHTLWDQLPENKELDQLFNIVMDSHQFQRLGYITQGTITHLSPTETRMHHTVEVVKVAYELGNECVKKGMNINIKKLMLAAILHDFGHSAFGHLGEKSNRYKTQDQKNIFEHDYKHAEQSVVIMEELFGHLPQTQLIKELKTAVLNHGGKDLMVNHPHRSKYGSPEGVLLMFCDEISRLGSDLKYTWFHGVASWDDLTGLIPAAPDLMLQIYRNFPSIDSLSEAIVQYFITDLLAHSNNRHIGLGTSGQKSKNVLDTLIRETLITRMRKLNHYDTWIKAMAFVLQDKSPENQIEFLRTATDETIYRYLKAAGFPLPYSGFVDPFSQEAGNLNYEQDFQLAHSA